MKEDKESRGVKSWKIQPKEKAKRDALASEIRSLRRKIELAKECCDTIIFPSAEEIANFKEIDQHFNSAYLRNKFEGYQKEGRPAYVSVVKKLERQIEKITKKYYEELANSIFPELSSDENLKQFLEEQIINSDSWKDKLSSLFKYIKSENPDKIPIFEYLGTRLLSQASQTLTDIEHTLSISLPTSPNNEATTFYTDNTHSSSDIIKLLSKYKGLLLRKFYDSPEMNNYISEVISNKKLNTSEFKTIVKLLQKKITLDPTCPITISPNYDILT